MSKKNYVVHYRNLKYYLSQGSILKKVHRVLEFKQSAWMRPYIDFYTQKRKEATNEADKNLFKLLDNAVYGKTMENMGERTKIMIAKTQKDFLKYASRPTYISHNIFGKNLVVIHVKMKLLTLNKPIYVGCTALQLSKLEMCKFHNGFMKDNVYIFELLYTDTDSFIYEIIGENFHEIIHKDCKYFCNNNKKVPGKMKDEYEGKIIYEVTILKSKMYSIRDINKNGKNVHKGYDSFIKYDEYEDTHSNKKAINH